MSVSSKNPRISLLRGATHLGKEEVKFQFDINVRSAQGLPIGTHAVKWTRGAKFVCTDPVHTENKPLAAIEIDQKLSLLCTLYRGKNSNSNTYEAKDSKLSLISIKDGKKNGKTIAKTRFNLADFAGVPTGKTILKLSNNISVDVNITSTFVRVSKGNANSIRSGLSGLSCSSGELENTELLADDSFIDDLNQSVELDSITSPTTPASNESFTTARAFFERDNIVGSVISSTVQTSMQPLQPGDSCPEKECTSPRSSGDIWNEASKRRSLVVGTQIMPSKIKGGVIRVESNNEESQRRGTQGQHIDGESHAMGQERLLQDRILPHASKTTEKIRKTIQVFMTEIRNGAEREVKYEEEIKALKAVNDDLVPQIQVMSTEATKGAVLRAKLEKERDDAITKIGIHEVSHAAAMEKEASYKIQISTLQNIVTELQEKAERAEASLISEMDALQGQVAEKDEEMRSMAVRIDSFESELSSKRQIAEELTSRTTELELESRLIEKQAANEVELAKMEAKAADRKAGDYHIQVERYKEEAENLKIVVESLEGNLKTSQKRTETEVSRLQSEFLESEKKSKETEERQWELEREVTSQKAFIQTLQNKLAEAVEENRRAVLQAEEKAKEMYRAIQEKELAEGGLQTAAEWVQEHERKALKLQERITQLSATVETSSKASKEAVNTERKRLREQAVLLEDAVRKEEGYKNLIAEQEKCLEKMKRETLQTVEIRERLSEQHKQAEKRVEETCRKLEVAEVGRKSKENEFIRKSYENGLLTEERDELKKQVIQLHETVSKLRADMARSEGKLQAVAAAGEADCAQIKNKLDEARKREESYSNEIARKTEVIEDLKRNLTEVVGEKAAAVELVKAELADCRSREEEYKKELEKSEADMKDVTGQLEDTNCNETPDVCLSQANVQALVYVEQIARLRTRIEKLETEQEEVERSVEERDTIPKYRRDGSLRGGAIREYGQQITDVHILEMLVETKMKLALAEEEKLQLENLIRMMKEGDRHVEKRLLKYAAELEIDMAESSQRAGCMQRKVRSYGASAGLVKSKSSRKGKESKGGGLQFFRGSGKSKTRHRDIADYTTDEKEGDDDGRSRSSSFSSVASDMG